MLKDIAAMVSQLWNCVVNSSQDLVVNCWEVTEISELNKGVL